MAKAYPEILSGVFDKAKFDQDYQLARDLAEIADVVGQANEAAAHTLTAVRSDALISVLAKWSFV